MVATDSSRELNDDVLAGEIELLGELVLAGSGVARHLTPEEVDDVLLLDPRPETPSSAGSTTSTTTAGSPPGVVDREDPDA